MPDKLRTAITGAVIAVALAAAVSYGLISQRTADKIQGAANQTLSGDQSAPPRQPNAPPPGPQDPNPQAGPAPRR
jgi:hypothetical protein